MTKLQFDNRFYNALTADSEESNYIRQVSSACYSKVEPTPTHKPELYCWSEELAADLGIDAIDVSDTDNSQKQYWTNILSGNALADGMQSYAMCYGGHQFGNWAGQLGDGRAINLGEIKTPKGNRTLQLKGAGPTPYSRTADGLAVMRSSIREYLCSEAMHHLGVPTTRALSLAATGDQVNRDMFYDGNPKLEQGAVVCRVAPSFIRFGNFEIFSSRQDIDNLKAIADFCIEYDYPELDRSSPTIYLDWFNEIARRTCDMVIHWQRVGFVHGVMNTDNMSILGLTIDYGPYGWLESYDPDWTPNTTDLPGRRYAYGNQPKVTHWNLYKLAEAIYPLVGDAEALQAALNDYPKAYEAKELSMQLSKLGISKAIEGDDALVTELTSLLYALEIDMTLFYRALAGFNESLETHLHSIADDLLKHSYQESPTEKDRDVLVTWLGKYQARLKQQGEPYQARKEQMNLVNPWFVLRNSLAQEAIDGVEKGDHSKLKELQKALLNPYSEQSEFAHLVTKQPDWAKNKAGCSMLSCSS